MVRSFPDKPNFKPCSGLSGEKDLNDRISNIAQYSAQIYEKLFFCI